MTAAPVLVEDDATVRLVTLNRPARRNALTAESYRLLAAALAEAAASASVQVVLFSGAGQAFCSGVDLQALAAAGSDTSEFVSGFDVLVEALATFPKPLIAAVQGAAVGLGLTMLLHCDIVLVAADARLRAPFTALGIAPEAASSWLLPRIVGAQRAADLLLTSRWIAGEEAVQLGLAARCLPADSLAAAARDLAHEIAALPGPALAATKLLLRADWPEQIRAAMRRERDVGQRYRSGTKPLGG